MTWDGLFLLLGFIFVVFLARWQGYHEGWEVGYSDGRADRTDTPPARPELRLLPSEPPPPVVYDWSDGAA